MPTTPGDQPATRKATPPTAMAPAARRATGPACQVGHRRVGQLIAGERSRCQRDCGGDGAGGAGHGGAAG
jgi:hypothetical protein